MRVLIYICCVITSFITLTSSFPLTQRSPDNADNESEAPVSKKSMNLKLLQKELARLIAQDDISKKTIRLKNLKEIEILPVLVELLAMMETQTTTNRDRRRRAVNATVDMAENDIPDHTSHKPSTTTFHPSTESNIEVLYKKSVTNGNREENRIRREELNKTAGELREETETFKPNLIEFELGRQTEDSEDEDEDEGGGGIGGLITMLLAPLSGGEGGGIDLDTLAALIGSLSAPTPDGGYDFSGLTNIISSFFAPDAEGNGGSDVGSFFGGVAAAALRGFAGERGPRGVGEFLGNLLAATLPGLSAPAGAGDDDENNANAGGKDSAGFFVGLLSNFVASSSGGGGGNGNKAEGSSSFLSKVFEIKMAIFRSIFSIVTSLLSSSSAHG